MTYLANLPNVLYDFTIKGESRNIYPVPDVLTKIVTYFDEQNYQFLTDDYLIIGSETPEHIAKKLYNDAYLHWTILYINKITNMGEQWPIPDRELRNLVADPDGIHHYEIGGVIADYSWIVDNYGEEYAIPVTNLDYETQINDVRRHIKVISPQHIGKFVTDFNSRLTS